MRTTRGKRNGQRATRSRNSNDASLYSAKLRRAPEHMNAPRDGCSQPGSVSALPAFKKRCSKRLSRWCLGAWCHFHINKHVPWKRFALLSRVHAKRLAAISRLCFAKWRLSLSTGFSDFMQTSQQDMPAYLSERELHVLKVACYAFFRNSVNWMHNGCFHFSPY